MNKIKLILKNNKVIFTILVSNIIFIFSIFISSFDSESVCNYGDFVLYGLWAYLILENLVIIFIVNCIMAILCIIILAYNSK